MQQVVKTVTLPIWIEQHLSLLQPHEQNHPCVLRNSDGLGGWIYFNMGTLCQQVGMKNHLLDWENSLFLWHFSRACSITRGYIIYIQGGAPPVITWCINHISVDISTTNHSCGSYKPT